MYLLGIPQGCSLGRDLVISFRARMGGIIPSQIISVATYVAQTADDSAQTACDSLGREDAPLGVIDPLRTSPGNLPGLLACVTCILELPPQVGVLGGIPSERRVIEHSTSLY
jgi:hypothetical protein